MDDDDNLIVDCVVCGVVNEREYYYAAFVQGGMGCEAVKCLCGSR